MKKWRKLSNIIKFALYLFFCFYLPQDTDSKILVSKLESSPEGEYLGVVMESKCSFQYTNMPMPYAGSFKAVNMKIFR